MEKTNIGILPGLCLTQGSDLDLSFMVLSLSPGTDKKIYKIGHLSTYLFKRLTGQWAMDEVNASITGMYDTVHNSGWSKEICEKSGVPMSILPPVKEQETPSNLFCRKWREKLGVGRNTMVKSGTQDVASALAGAGADKKGKYYVISGSSEMIAILTDKPDNK